MKRTTSLLTVGIIALTVVGPSDLRAQTSEEEAEIKAVLIDMWDAIEQGDLDRYAAHVHPDFTSFGETALYLAEGKELEVQAMRNWYESTPGVHTDMHQPKVEVRGDVAWITYYWTDYGTRPTSEGYSSRGKSTRIFVKENGRWLCIHGHYTAVE